MKLAVLLTLLSSTALAQGVYTRSYDNARTGAQPLETTFTADAIRSKGLVRTTRIPVIGDRVGDEAQPLIATVAGVPMMTLASEANVVRAVRPDDGTGIWQTQPLCTPIKANPSVDLWGTNDHIGIMSTPVIDPDTAKEYLVAMCSEDNSGIPQTGRHHVFILDLKTGAVLKKILIDGKDGSQQYSAALRKQRSSLLLTNVNGVKFVWWGSGSFLETTNGSAGWLFGLDTYDDTIKFVWASTQGRGGGIWLSGQGAAADDTGHIYVGVGNGSYNAVNDFGESSVQLLPTYPTATTSATLSVVASWAAFSDAGRVGQLATLSDPFLPKVDKLSGVSAPTENLPVGANMADMPMGSKTRTTSNGTKLVYALNAQNNAQWSDEDANLAHMLVLRKRKYITAGKDGLAYVLDIDKFPRTQPADFADTHTNCAKVKGPYSLPAYPGNVDLCPQDMTQMNFSIGGKTRHIHSSLALLSQGQRDIIFAGGENSPVQAFEMAADGSLTYLGNTDEIASYQSTGMPGTMISVSSNQGQDAVLWGTQPAGDANRIMTAGRLCAWDANPDHYTTRADGSKRIPLLWSNADWGINFGYSKFTPPVVFQGRAYVTTSDGTVDVYSLTGAR